MNSVYLVERKWEGKNWEDSEWEVACLVDSPKTARDIVRATFPQADIGIIVHDDYRFQLIRKSFDPESDYEVVASYWCRMMQVRTGEPS